MAKQVQKFYVQIGEESHDVFYGSAYACGKDGAGRCYRKSGARKYTREQAESIASAILNSGELDSPYTRGVECVQITPCKPLKRPLF